jgi:SnoaL-like protein
MQALEQAAHAHDVEALIGCLAPDVVVRSPITQRIRFIGIEQVAELFREVFAVIADIRLYETIGEGQRDQVIFWRGRVGRHYLEEANLLRLDAHGRVREMTVFMRPLPGLLVLASALAPALARRRGRLRALVVKAMLGAIATIYCAGEPLAVALSGAGVPVARSEQRPLVGAGAPSE